MAPSSAATTLAGAAADALTPHGSAASRPLPGGFGPKVNSSLSHRHLDLVLHGMRAAAQQPPELSGSALTSW